MILLNPPPPEKISGVTPSEKKIPWYATEWDWKYVFLFFRQTQQTYKDNYLLTLLFKNWLHVSAFLPSSGQDVVRKHSGMDMQKIKGIENVGVFIRWEFWLEK
jgi:hypothetical protein